MWTIKAKDVARYNGNSEDDLNGEKIGIVPDVRLDGQNKTVYGGCGGVGQYIGDSSSRQPFVELQAEHETNDQIQQDSLELGILPADGVHA
jgi:hypothetical protein